MSRKNFYITSFARMTETTDLCAFKSVPKRRPALL